VVLLNAILSKQLIQIISYAIFNYSAEQILPLMHELENRQLSYYLIPIYIYWKRLRDASAEKFSSVLQKILSR